jgi:superfamily II DNA or RNA helicase
MLRPYQSRVVDFLLPRQRAFGIAPAGSGKTIMAAEAVRRKAAPFDRVVWLANTREQCEQARAAAVLVGLPLSVALDVYCVAAQPDVSGADIVIIDECHHLPARTWWSTVIDFEGAVYGFSATPWSGDWERDGVLKAFFGEENFIKIDRKEVQDGGSITAGVVHIHDLDTPGEFDPQINTLAAAEVRIRAKRYPLIPEDEHLRRARWEFTQKATLANEARNAKIAALASADTRSTLVLVATIEHGEQLAAQIPGAVVVYSRMGIKRRRAAIAGFRDGSLRVMVATSLADEGLDVPRAAVLILAAGGRSAGKLEQRAGRVMRPHESKEIGEVHDFADAGASLAHNQYKARRRTYRALGYTIIQ